VKESRFITAAKACLENGERILHDADTLVPSPTSLALAVIAEEEFAKGFFLFLVADGTLLGTRTCAAQLLIIAPNSSCRC
jgi:hypothetical protein